MLQSLQVRSGNTLCLLLVANEYCSEFVDSDADEDCQETVHVPHVGDKDIDLDSPSSDGADVRTCMDRASDVDMEHKPATTDHSTSKYDIADFFDIDEERSLTIEGIAVTDLPQNHLLKNLDLPCLRTFLEELRSLAGDFLGKHDASHGLSFFSNLQGNQTMNLSTVLDAADDALYRDSRERSGVGKLLEEQTTLLQLTFTRKWIERAVSEASQAIENKEDHSFTLLWFDVIDEWKKKPRTPKTFCASASAYLPDAVRLQGRSGEYAFPGARSKKPSSNSIRVVVASILEQWVYPRAQYDVVSTELAFHLICTFGPNILLHKPVISAIQDPYANVFVRQGVRRIPLERMQDWTREVVMMPSTEILSVVNEIGKAVDIWRTHAERQISSLFTDLHFLSIQWYNAQSKSEGFEGLEGLWSMLLPLLPLVQHDSILPLQEGENENLCAFWELYQEYIDFVMENPDWLLPWRDLGRSRRIILKNDGPYSHDYLHTKEGLFSAIVYRGFTHNSRFLHTEEKTLFHDYAEWENIVASSKQTFETSVRSNHPDISQSALEKMSNNYIIDTRAYGRSPNAHRAYKNVITTWNSLQEPSTTDWLTKFQSPSFATVYKIFVGSQNRKAKAFPGLGPLTSFLLTSDYAIAGAVKMPSPEDIGQFLYTNMPGLGARAGLCSMGYSCSSTELTKVAFRQVHEYLSAAIPSNLQKHMNFNVFVTEHCLCKYNRLFSRIQPIVLAVEKLSVEDQNRVHDMWEEGRNSLYR